MSVSSCFTFARCSGHGACSIPPHQRARWKRRLPYMQYRSTTNSSSEPGSAGCARDAGSHFAWKYACGSHRRSVRLQRRESISKRGMLSESSLANEWPTMHFRSICASR
eukprot:scaffold130812_cov35-Tisochrysis_lutea.AAC.1